MTDKLYETTVQTEEQAADFEAERLELLHSINDRLGYIYAILLICVILKFLWTLFDKWFFGH